MFNKNTTIEEIVNTVPESVSYLMNKNIRCIRCGEPIWGTLEEACKNKGFKDEEIQTFVKDLNNLTINGNKLLINEEVKLY